MAGGMPHDSADQGEGEAARDWVGVERYHFIRTFCGWLIFLDRRVRLEKPMGP
jgi:hypothetical protein